jgi:asparagine synthase (glutamine-hydrolysing)
MPGIVGLISAKPVAECRAHLSLMLQSMLHEQSYQWGTCEESELGVYAGWVSHPQSFASMESGSDESGQLDLAFAGECYGVGTLDDVQARFSSPQSRSVGRLLRHYDCERDDWVRQLNGLFSGLLIDRRRRRALLFNDRYGVERVYVHEAQDGTYFASEAKALLAVIPAVRSFDEDGVAEFLAFGCPLNGRSLFRGIRVLEGGSTWSFDRTSCKKTRYFFSEEWEHQPALGSEEFQEEFERRFKRVLPHYFDGVHRVGVSLTGGLDSRMIMACLPSLEEAPTCYTFTGSEGRTLDAQLSSRVAAECGLEHRLIRIEAEFFADYNAYVDRTVYITDGTAGPTWSHEIYLTGKSRQLAPVRMTGNFGSEVLRGMSTFKPINLDKRLMASGLREKVSALALTGPACGDSPVTFAAFREAAWKLYGIAAAGKSQLVLRTPYLDNELVALAYRAPAISRRSATSALRLVQNSNPRLAAIPTDRGVAVGRNRVTQILNQLVAEISFKLDYMYHEDPPRGSAILLQGLERLGERGPLGLHKWLPYRIWFQKQLATCRCACEWPAQLCSRAQRGSNVGCDPSATNCGRAASGSSPAAVPPYESPCLMVRIYIVVACT